MNDLDYELRKLFCRRDPPPGFADRLMARIPQRRRPGYGTWLGAIAAALLLLLAGTSMWQQHSEQQRRAQAEKAKADLVYALEVTSDSLQTVARALQATKTGGDRI